MTSELEFGCSVFENILNNHRFSILKQTVVYMANSSIANFFRILAHCDIMYDNLPTRVIIINSLEMLRNWYLLHTNILIHAWKTYFISTYSIFLDPEKLTFLVFNHILVKNCSWEIDYYFISMVNKDYKSTIARQNFQRRK